MRLVGAHKTIKALEEKLKQKTTKMEELEKELKHKSKYIELLEV